MTWNNPPRFVPTVVKGGKKITPEQLAGDSEHSQQVALFAWAANSVGKYPQLAYMFAIPNGGLRDVRTATNLKAEGVKAGVPDIFLPVMTQTEWAKMYFGCFIEMKREKYRTYENGGCSDAQIDFINYATNAGYYCKVCYNWREASDILMDYLEGKV